MARTNKFYASWEEVVLHEPKSLKLNTQDFLSEYIRDKLKPCLYNMTDKCRQKS